MTNSAGKVGYLAAACALAYGAVALVWTVTGSGYPFGANNPSDDLHPLRAVPVDIGAAVFAVALLGAGVLALATAGRQAVHPPRGVRAILLGLGWTVAAALVVLVPGAHVLAIAGYTPALLIGAPFGWPPDLDYGVIFNWTTANEVAAIGTGVLLAWSLLVWQRRTTSSAHRDGPVRWGTAVTYAAAAAPAAYAASRLGWALAHLFGSDKEMIADGDFALIATGLGGFALVGAWLTIGLVRPWGERFPRWMIGLAGRRVPIRLATIPATMVAVAVAAASASFLSDPNVLRDITSGDLAFLPMALWPLWSVTLLLATYAYHRRRTAPTAATTDPAADVPADDVPNVRPITDRPARLAN
ncbi:hypothetical protein O7635_06310 [Asanoa sp. WMMD1127]|uniref:hypothetical protein n=1 Tax=Asanoa sp. WMMD1127 TaxID=3016107 RepID=UPI0024174512|nr:hypothetical protein [Asanoa sp. WMMD1127]MDG4821468.1 hypothetical protein [Asanoa sp. WMMD1127]